MNANAVKSTHIYEAVLEDCWLSLILANLVIEAPKASNGNITRNAPFRG